MRKRKEMGLTFFKMDLHTELIADRPNAVNERGVATDKGLGYLCEFIAAIRDAIGWTAPLAADHFGPLNVNDAIRYAKAFEPYQLAWAEDLLQTREGPRYPWQNWRGYKAIAEATTTPVNTGEDIFGLEDGFRPLIDNHRSEEHTSELQSLRHLVCRLLLEKKKIKNLEPTVLNLFGVELPASMECNTLL